MLKPTTISDLREELAKIDVQIAKLADRKAAIRCLLALDGQGPVEIAEPEDPEFGDETIELGAMSSAGTFRELVRGALGAIGRPADTAEIAETILRSGWRPSGKTDAKTLVSSELWRAEKKAEGVVRVGRGRYALMNGESHGGH